MTGDLHAAPRWATVTTLKETPRRVQEFVAHHLHLGASEIWLFFDDPDDPAIALVEGIPGVRAVPCTPEHKAVHANRAGTLEGRQKANANHAYHRSAADWIIHLDADEMVWADTDVSALLAAAGGDVIRLAPFEWLFHAKAGKDGRPTHYFRGQLPNNRRGRATAEQVYGRFAPVLSRGMLGHTAGKHFVRTGVDGMRLSIHAPFRDGQRVKAAETAAARLLHLHGGDWGIWRAHLDRRLAEGAYMPKLQRRRPSATAPDAANLYETLRGLERRRGEAGIRRFWERVCTFGPEKRYLKRHGALWKGNLDLEAKVAALFGEPDGSGARA